MKIKIFQLCMILYMIPLRDMIDLCRRSYGDVCYKCEDDNSNCIPLLNNTKIIYIGNSTNFDYKSYINTNIKMIYEQEKITFYDCGKMLMQVKSSNYYPIDRNLTFSKHSYSKNVNYVNIVNLQTCLENYCLVTRNHRLECLELHIETLDFAFNTITTLECIQNITSARILSARLEHLQPNSLFFNALNLIYLEITIKQFRTFYCEILKPLRNLRVLVIYSQNFKKIIDTECFFQFNPNLIKIGLNNKLYWRTCFQKNNLNKVTFANILITTFLISTLLLFMLAYIFRRKINNYCYTSRFFGRLFPQFVTQETIV